MVPADDGIIYHSRVRFVSVDAPSTERRSLQCGLRGIDISCIQRRKGKQTGHKNVILDPLRASVTLRYTLSAGSSGDGRPSMSKPNCAHIKPDGSRCGAYAHGDSEFCFVHDPPSSDSARKVT
jgi:hypothetical protein